MSSKFTTPLILSSALMLGALGFMACGEDTGTNIPNQPTPTSSSGAPYIPPEPTAISSIDFHDDLGVSAISSTKIKFKGTIGINIDDSVSVEDQAMVRFVGLNIAVVNSAGIITGNYHFNNPQSVDFVASRVTEINFQEAELYTDLDENYTECGNFTLKITATVDDGLIMSVDTASIPFVRPEEKCKIPESSSSSAPKIPGGALDSVSINFSTKTDKCLDLATATFSSNTTGDICFTRVGDGKVSVSSTTGIKFAKYDNQSDTVRENDWMRDWYPPTPTTDDFMYTEAALADTYADILYESDVFFVAINPLVYQPNTGNAAGFYAFLVNTSVAKDGNDLSFTLLLYKAK